MDNRKIIANYIKQGCKYRQTEDIGIELEHFIIEKESGKNVSYSGKYGVRSILEEISKFFDKKVFSEGFLIALSNGRYHLTLEPSAQLEISICPTSTIKEAEEIYEEFIKIITPVLDNLGYELITEGYRRTDQAENLELIPKKRYEFMDKYFETSGMLGKNMMRSTASVQISIDYADENDCVEKFRLANVLSPLFALICDNTKYFEGKKFNGRMARTYIWDNVDRDRCGIVPNIFDTEFGFYKYAEYIYNNPAILVIKDGEPHFTGKEKISSIYKGKEILPEEAEHLLSMFFPDVRLKQYIEIRSADSMPIEYSLSYAALVKGIFKDTSMINIDHITVLDIENAKTELIKNGFNGFIYGEKAYKICDRLIESARKNLRKEDEVYLLPIEKIIKGRKTLREMN